MAAAAAAAGAPHVTLRNEASMLDRELEAMMVAYRASPEAALGALHYPTVARAMDFLLSYEARFEATWKQTTRLPQGSTIPHAVLLYGPTNAGKTTLLNHLAGNPLTVRRSTNRKPILSCDAGAIGVIGVGHGSTTVMPNVWVDRRVPNEPVYYIDLPGAQEIGVLMPMLNVYIHKWVLQSINQAKVLLVATPDITDAAAACGTLFVEFLNTLGEFLPHCAPVAVLQRHLALMIMRADTPPAESVLGVKDNVQHMKNIDELKQATLDLFPMDEAAALADVIVKVATMTAPQLSQVGQPYQPPPNQAQHIETALSHAAYLDLRSNEAVHRLAAHDGTVPRLHGPASIMMRVVKAKAASLIRSILVDYINDPRTEYPTIRDVDGFITALRNLLQVRVVPGQGEISEAPPTTMARFLAQFEQHPFFRPVPPRRDFTLLMRQMDWLSSFSPAPDDATANWAQLVLQPLLAPVIANAQDLLNSSTNLLPPSDWNAATAELTFAGHSVSLRNIVGHFQGHAGMRHLRVFALHTVIIDADLRLPGINVTIIAPNWQVLPDQATGMRVIDLSGTGARNREGQGAAQTDGEPGFAGSFGGHFVGLSENSSFPRLRINVCGGGGGAGQRGGDGNAGQPGADASLSIGQPGGNLLGDWQWTEPCDGGRLDQDVHKAGVPGTQGGNPGRGGQGGYGGGAGSCFLGQVGAEVQATVTAIVLAQPGQPGANGGAGTPGAGGRHGSWARSIWHRRKDTWMELTDHNGHGFNGHCPPRLELQGFAAPGSIPAGVNAAGIEAARNSQPANHLLASVQDYALAFSGFKLGRACVREFYRSCMTNRNVLAQLTVDAFLVVINTLETHLSRHANSQAVFIPCFEALLELAESFSPLVAARERDNITLMQLIYSTLLSRCWQLRTSRSGSLVVNLGGYLDTLSEQLARYRTLTQEVLVDAAHVDYRDQISAKMAEADVILDLLMKDIAVQKLAINGAINQLVLQIQTLIAAGQAQSAELQHKRDELKRVLERKTFLAFLSIGIQCAGMCFGPIGPVVAEVVNVGLNLALSPTDVNHDQAIAGIAQVSLAASNSLLQISAQQTRDQQADLRRQAGLPPLPLDAGELSVSLAQLARVGAEVATVAAAAMRNNSAGMDEVARYDLAITRLEEAVRQLTAYQRAAGGPFRQLVAHMHAQLEQQMRSYAGHSIVALQYKRFETKVHFNDMRRQVSAFTQGAGSSAGDQLLHLFGRVNDALETAVNVYEQVNRYQEQKSLATYMAQLASPAMSEAVRGFPADVQTQWNRLMQTIHRNVILERYSKAVSATAMCFFPFAEAYLAEGQLLSSFVDLRASNSASAHAPQHSSEWIAAYLGVIQAHVRSLRTNVQDASNMIGPVHNVLSRCSFRQRDRCAPLFTWSTNDATSRESLQQLFNWRPVGQAVGDRAVASPRVVFFADVLASRSEVHELDQQQAIKCNELELVIRFATPARQRELEALLPHLMISFTHSNQSHYYFNGSVYSLGGETSGHLPVTFVRSFATRDGGTPVFANESVRKLAEAPPVLSPYTHWIIELGVWPGQLHFSLTDGDVKRAHLARLFEEEMNAEGGAVTMTLEGAGTCISAAQTLPDQHNDEAAVQYFIGQNQLAHLRPNTPNLPPIGQLRLNRHYNMQ